MLKSLFNKVAGPEACNFIKKKLQHRCFSVKFAKFLRTPILKNICERLLLILQKIGTGTLSFIKSLEAYFERYTNMRCFVRLGNHLYNSKKVKNTHGVVLLLVKLQASVSN